VASFVRQRLLVLALVTLGLGVAGIVLALDGRARVTRGGAAREHTARIARVTGLPELALSASSTWLRHPALAAPSAAVFDAPLGLDVDPAGAVIPTRGREPEITLRREDVP
jgi:hypothetical protein